MSEPKRSRRFWRILRRLAVIGVVLLVVARIALPYALPSILNSATPGVRWDWERSSFSITGGSIEFGRLSIVAKDQPEQAPIAQIELIQVDVDMLALLGGDLVIERVEIDGADLEVRRGADGAWNFDAFSSGEESEEEPEEEEPEEPLDPNRPFDPTPGIQLIAGRLQHLRVHVEDKLATPPVDTWLELSLRVTDLGDPARDGRASLVVTGSDIDVFRLDADWNEGERSLSGGAELELAGLRTAGLQPWLRELGIATQPDTRLAAQLRAQVDLGPESGPESKAAGSIALLDTRLLVDDQTVTGLEELRIGASQLVGSGGRIDEVVLTGIRAAFGLSADGSPSFGSISLLPPNDAAQAESAPDAGEERPAGQEPADEAASGLWEIGSIAVRDGLVEFEDRSLPGGPIVALALEEASIDDLSKNDGTDLRLQASIPGAIERIAVGGSLITGPDNSECGLDLAIDGIVLSSLEPWLGALDCESTLESGRFRGQLSFAARQDPNGALRARGLIRDLLLSDGDEPLFELDRVALEQVVVSESETVLGAVDVDGLKFRAERAPDGRVLALGLALGGGAEPGTEPELAGAEEATPTEAPTAEAPSPTSANEPTRFAIGRAQLKDTEIAWLDRSVEPPVTIGPSRFEFSLADLEIGGEGAAGSWSFRVSQGAVFDEFVASGRLVDNERSFRADAEWNGVGLDFDRLAGYLQPAGLESTLAAGSFRGSATVTAEGAREARQPTIEITNLELTDRSGDEPLPLFELPLARVDSLRDDGIAGVTIEGLRVRLEEDETGNLSFFGLRTLPTSPEGEPDDGGEDPFPAAAPQQTPTPTDASPFQIDSVRLADAAITFARPESQGGTLVATLEAEAVELVDGMPSTATVNASIPEVLERLELNARRGEGPEALSASLDAGGLGPKLQQLLPPGVEVLDRGLELQLSLSREQDDEGRKTTAIQDFRVTGSEGEILLGADTIRLVESPLADGPVALSAIVDGIVGRIEQSEEGLVAVGMRFSGAEDPATDSAGETTEAAQDPVEPTAAPNPDPLAPATPPVEIYLRDAQITLRELTFVDTTNSESTPLALSGNLRTTAPIRVGAFRARDELEGESAQRKTGLELKLSAAPLMKELSATLEVDLQSSDPHAELQLDVNGLDGRTLGQVLPSLAGSIDATAVENGRIQAELIADLHAPRRADGLPDTSAGFGLDVLLRDVSIRPDAASDPQLALDRFEVIVDRIQPDGSARIDLVEASGLFARLRSQPDGLNVAGITLLNPPEEPGSTNVDQSSEQQEASTTESAPKPAPTTEGPVAEGPVVGIERLLLQDVDLSWTDATTDVEQSLPLEDVDLEVQGLRFPAGPKPVAISAYLRSGDAMLPAPAAQSSAIGGLLSATRSIVTSDSGSTERDPRPIFEELSASGALRLDGPSPRGRLRFDLGGFEMLALQPFARPAEVDIRSGILDTRATLDFRGSNGIQVESQLVFRDLLVRDRGNKLSGALALSIPLESTLYLLRNQRGEQVIPLNFRIDEKNGASLTGAATSALASVLGEAIASSPLRVTGVLTDGLGLTGSEKEEPIAPEILDFLGGSVDWGEDADRALNRALNFVTGNKEHRLVLQHQLGAADLELAEKLANPESGEIRDVVRRIRQRRDLLRVERAEAAVRARSLFGSGRIAEGQAATRKVRAIDREIGQAETALDELLALLRPGAERRASRRTRDAAAALGRRRLERLREELLARGGNSIRDRIELRGARGEVTPDLDQGGQVIIQLLRRPGR